MNGSPRKCQCLGYQLWDHWGHDCTYLDSGMELTMAYLHWEGKENQWLLSPPTLAGVLCSWFRICLAIYSLQEVHQAILTYYLEAGGALLPDFTAGTLSWKFKLASIIFPLYSCLQSNLFT